MEARMILRSAWLALLLPLVATREEKLECRLDTVTAGRLLQTSKHLESSDRFGSPTASPTFIYDAASMWGFASASGPWRLLRSGSGCELSYPARSNISASKPPPRKVSGFSLDRCPGVWAPRRRWRIDLALPASRSMEPRLHPGTNPAIIRLPPSLQSHFPEGQWLVVSRLGWARCPGMHDFEEGTLSFLGNLWGLGSYLAVLNEDFEVLSKAEIAMKNSDVLLSIEDVRLWPISNGDVIISFMAYSEADRLNGIVAKLHITADSTGLQAWVDRHEVRRAQNCGQNASAAKKNLGFFGAHGATYVLDRIYPMRVDRTDLGVLEASREEDTVKEHNHTYWNHFAVAALCTDAHVRSMPPATPGPWHQCTGQLKELFLHNGPHPIFIEERGFFLGLGHLVRGQTTFRSGYELPDHYTHQYFAFSADPPFKLMALSPEFCFSSEQNPEDCESIQFASSMLRYGDELFVGFGVQDCDSFVHQFDLQEVLRSLVAIQT